jgi:tetratricopeptide (TPR) repeat protein
MLGRLQSLFNRGLPADPGSALALGIDSLRHSDVKRALREFARAVAARPDDPELLQHCGRALADAGYLAEAEGYLRQALEVRRAEPGLATDLGNVVRARGDREGARRCYEQALAGAPGFVPALLNLGSMDLADGLHALALARFKQVLALDPSNAAALRHAGEATYALGDFAEAERFCREALRSGEDADGAYALACALSAQGRQEEAVAMLERSAASNAAHLPTLRLLGALALARGHHDAAVGWLERAADLAPDDAGLQSNLGLAYTRVGRTEEAVDVLQLALHHQPELAAAHVNLGLVHGERREWADAAEEFSRGTELAPEDPQAAAGLARALQQLYRLEEADVQFRRALELTPASPELWTRLGQVYRDLGRYREARSALEQALAVDPGYVYALTHLGLVALDLRDPAHGIDCFDRVLASGAGLDDEVLFNITCARLLCGDWERGWEFWGLRWRSPDAIVRPYHFPEWDGADLRGKTLLVYAEQGLGDEIMFASCYGELLPRVRHLVIECSPKLEKLFRRSFPEASVFACAQADPAGWLEAAPRIDVQAACGTVASQLRGSRASFPEHSGYLRPDEKRVAHWRDRLAALGPGVKIGISWRGGTNRTRTRLRSMALADWLPIFELGGADFVSLQYQPDAAAELDALARERGIRVHHWQEAIDDYDETAALAAAVDVIVTVCTAIVHLGGALGRPVRVMVPASPEWRYGLLDDRMPWYPSVRLLRQRQAARWDDIVTATRLALADEFPRLRIARAK